MLAQIYVSLAPALFAAVLNMVWVKLPVLRLAAIPIDAGRRWRDGRRVLGDNKTWKGLIGLVGLGAVCGVVWGAVVSHSPMAAYHLFHEVRPSSPAWDFVTGALLGLAYGLFELPNSFLKRRLGIPPGKKRPGRVGALFVVLDQIDSVIGCALVLALLTPIGVDLFLAIVVTGGVTHLVLVLVLYTLRLRVNPL